MLDLMRTRGLLSAFLLFSLVVGCVSEAERYQRNKIGVHLSPRARHLLSQSDLDEIARVVAHGTDKRIIAISMNTKRDPRGILDITVGVPGGSQPSDFGIYIVDRRGGAWQITAKYDGLSTSLVGLGFDDPPDPYEF